MHDGRIYGTPWDTVFRGIKRHDRDPAAAFNVRYPRFISKGRHRRAKIFESLCIDYRSSFGIASKEAGEKTVCFREQTSC